MARITTYDKLRGCYVIEPDNDQNHIQRLGELEDRDEAKEWIHWTDDRKDYAKCPTCDYGEEGEVYAKNATPFCPACGQRLTWGD